MTNLCRLWNIHLVLRRCPKGQDGPLMTYDHSAQQTYLSLHYGLDAVGHDGDDLYHGGGGCVEHRDELIGNNPLDGLQKLAAFLTASYSAENSRKNLDALGSGLYSLCPVATYHWRKK
eukprot:3298013-Ditylum_brightwellii.AAC.1